VSTVVATADGSLAHRQLRLVATAQVLAMATWFAATAVAPALRDQWSVGAVGSTLLISAVQVGFVVGALAAAATNLPDRVHPPLLMAVGSCAAAATTAALALLPTGFGGAVVLRLLTGIALAAVYPVGMKLAVSWFDRGRGLAVGVLVGALTVGSTLPLLVSGLLGDAWREALLVAAGLAVLAALVLRGVRVGPLVSAATALDPRAALQVLRVRESRLAVLGYLGHMWELYAVWVWLPLYVTASLRAAGEDPTGAQVGVLCFVALGVLGLAGCVGAGRLGDRVGRARTAAGAMVVSGVCCVVAALAFGAPPWVTVLLLAVWGPSVIADSALFSACLGSVVPRDHVGTALTLQTALGFLLTVVSIQLVPVVEAGLGWPVAVGLLAVGPLAGAVAMLRLPDPSRPVTPTRTIPTEETA
jgi:MFS family permease